MKNHWQRYLVLTLCIVVLLYAATWAFRSCVRSVAEAPKLAVSGVSKETVGMLRGVSEVFIKAFNLQPEVRVQEQVVLSQSSPLAEFAVIERDILHHYEWKHKWLGSEKCIVIEGVFRAKAGFDLREPFVVSMDANGEVRADLPPAKILSVEQLGEIKFQDRDGFWNKLSSDDRQQALNAFVLSAKDKVANGDLVTLAEQQALERIQELAKSNGKSLTVKFRVRE